MGIVSEFKEFVSRGNVMDMAVGIIIGSAITAVVTSLTEKIIQPILSLLGAGESSFGPVLPNGEVVDFGAFISAIINFLIIALVLFFILKAMNNMRRLGKKEEEAVEEEAPVCPFCKEEVKPGATRCPHCAGEFETPAA